MKCHEAIRGVRAHLGRWRERYISRLLVHGLVVHGLVIFGLLILAMLEHELVVHGLLIVRLLIVGLLLSIGKGASVADPRSVKGETGMISTLICTNGDTEVAARHRRAMAGGVGAGDNPPTPRLACCRAELMKRPEAYSRCSRWRTAAFDTKETSGATLVFLDTDLVVLKDSREYLRQVAKCKKLAMLIDLLAFYLAP